ncbi:L-histidine N(alpha)-methyltransferase [Streptomyces sp. ISL-11]|uniref:L-histidine N(alpha)-methyltransferase n=1 Tax=Streptomyces sp. ISL-11 TaxID=2819174 RepID=UPI001BEB4832|nr:L-histidine N(alpha)-methyltransferase [Streptomyces sp. ISL-11]MBT2384541.1 L-histidine N(alpha)-methyltransferase [Streptomyces sp. ISL-11]
MPHPTQTIHTVSLTGPHTDDNDTLLRTGLTSTPKHLPTLFGYDRTGSALYEEIIRLPDYYPATAERRLLSTHATHIARTTAATALIDLGAGAAEKTPLLLEPLDRHTGLTAYTAVDISAQPLRDAAHRIHHRFPHARVTTVHGDFIPALNWLRHRGEHRLLALLGSTYGNLSPTERHRFLHALRDACGPTDHFLLCADLSEPADAIERAYSAGYHGPRPVRRLAALNCLTHLNHRYDADFDPTAFHPEITYDRRTHDVRATLRSLRTQHVTLPGLGLGVTFTTGEQVTHALLHKFTLPELLTEVAQAGFHPLHHWTEPTYQYAALLFR